MQNSSSAGKNRESVVTGRTAEFSQVLGLLSLCASIPSRLRNFAAGAGIMLWQALSRGRLYHQYLRPKNIAYPDLDLSWPFVEALNKQGVRAMEWNLQSGAPFA